MVTKICPICKRRYKTVHPNQTHCHGEDCTKEGERLRKKRNTRGIVRRTENGCWTISANTPKLTM